MAANINDANYRETNSKSMNMMLCIYVHMYIYQKPPPKKRTGLRDITEGLRYITE